jgi:hypothetical protein
LFTAGGFAAGFHPRVRIQSAGWVKIQPAPTAHANKIEAQLRGEVQALLDLGEKADRAAVPDGMDVPAEIARREQRLKAIDAAKAQIEQRARERFEVEQQEHQAKLQRRQAQREAGPAGSLKKGESNSRIQQTMSV